MLNATNFDALKVLYLRYTHAMSEANVGGSTQRTNVSACVGGLKKILLSK